MMKRSYIFIYHLIVLFILAQVSVSCNDSGCSLDESDFADKFELHLQHGFDQTYVHIKIDDKTIFFGEATTDNTISLAAIISVNILKGSHTIKIYSDTMEADTSFILPDTMIIGIIRDFSTKEISFGFYYPPNFPIYE